jgi:hypothetical protein
MTKWLVLKSYFIFAYLMLRFLAVEFSSLFQCEAVLGVFLFPGFNLLCFVIVHHACFMGVRGVVCVGTGGGAVCRVLCCYLVFVTHANVE